MTATIQLKLETDLNNTVKATPAQMKKELEAWITGYRLFKNKNGWNLYWIADAKVKVKP